MRKNALKLGVITLMLLWVGNSAFAQSEEPLVYQKTLPVNNEYIREFDQIASLRKTQDVAGLAKLATSLPNEWKKSGDRDHYFILMDFTIRALGSCGLQNDKALFLARDYAATMLQEDSPLPLDIESDILPYTNWPDFCEYHQGKYKAEAWSKLRRDRIAAWLGTWSRFQSMQDNTQITADPGKFALLANTIMQTSFRSTPEEIAANSKTRSDLDELRRSMAIKLITQRLFFQFKTEAEQAIVAYYSQEPYDLEELNHSLSLSITDKQVRAKMLDEVTKNMHQVVK